MSQKTYQYGETLNITILGAQVFSCGERGLFINIPGDDAGVRLPCGPDGLPIAALSIERVSPSGGPVEPGDLWRDVQGGVWLGFLHQMRHGGREVRLTRGVGDEHSGSVRAISADFGPLTLMFREALVSQPGADGPGAEYTDEAGCTWVARSGGLLSPPGVDDPGRWRTRGEVEEMAGKLTPVTAPVAPVADPLAVASQQLRESTNGDEFAAAFGGFMSALGQAAEHEQGFHDDCDPATCGDAAQAQAEERAEQAAAAAEVQS